MDRFLNLFCLGVVTCVGLFGFLKLLKIMDTRYAIREEKVSIYAFGFLPIYTIYFADITVVTILGPKSRFSYPEYWVAATSIRTLRAGRFFGGNFVLVEQKGRIVKYIFLNIDDTSKLLRAARAQNTHILRRSPA